MHGNVPSLAANAASNNTYPAINQEVFTNSPLNFTTGIRDDTSFNRNWDSANLIVQQSDQVAYSNTSLTNLGTYNATYSFTDDRAGGLAEGFAYPSTSTATSAQVITPYLGHQKVLQIYDNGAGGADYVYVINTFAAQTTGTVSFWFCFTPITCQYIRIYLDDGVVNGVDLLFGNSLVQAYNGGWATILTPTANRWYHFNVTFTAGATRTYNVDIDGKRVATGYAFQQAATTITRFLLYTDGAGTTNYYGWLDALDYSWTPGYDAGKSRNAIDLGQVGVYNATQSFENETMFSLPAGFVDESPASCDVRVVPNAAINTYGHHNILCMEDMTAGNYARANWTLPGTLSGTSIAEFWIMSEQVANYGRVFFYKANTGSYATYVHITSNTLYCGGIAVLSIGSGVWYHVRLRFDFAAQTYSCWVNGMLKLSNTAFSAAVNQVNLCRFDTDNAPTGYCTYFDAFDFSFDSQFYSERSTYLRLNSTTTFPVPGTMLSFPVAGAYAYKYQIWSSNVAYDQGPVPFTVVDVPVPDNVQLISASGAETNWVFIDPTTCVWNTLYNSSFPYETWTFSNYGWINIPYATIAGDAYTLSTNPGSNTGANTFVELRTAERFGFLQMPASPYLTDNGTTGLKIYLSSVSSSDVVPISVDAVGSFDESTITFTNQPEIVTHLTDYNRAGGAGVWDYVSFNSNYTHVKLTINTGVFYVYQYRSKEYGSFTPMANYTVGKTAQDSHHVMMQANTTETITMRSPTLSSLDLEANDKITVMFSTSSQRQITLNLKDGGNTVKSLTLVDAPNYAYTSQTKTFAITGDLTIDQLEFTGLFDDMKNLQITNVSILRPTTFTAIDLAPYSKEITYLSPTNYSLTIFEGGDLVLSQTAQVNAGTINKFSYTPLAGGQRIVNFFNPSGDILNFYQFRCNLTRTYNNLTVNYLLTTPYFYADDGSAYQLNVTDRFGNYLTGYSDVITTFIDITLSNIYSLKIKNEMRLPTLLQLTRNGITQLEYAMAGEIVEYTLWNGTYEFNYTQAELNVPVSINLDVTATSIYNISTAYYNVYFSAFSNDALGLPVDTIRLYINGTRKSWGPVELLGALHNVTALDYVNDTQYSGIVNLAGVAEMNVFVNIATVITNNLDNENPLSIAIRKNGILLQNQTVGYGNSLSFRFTNGYYTISAFYLNGTSYGADQTVNVLASGSELTTYTLNWGSYHPDLPQAIPTPGFPEFLMLIAIISVIALIAVGIYASHQRSKRVDADRLRYEVLKRGK